MGDKSPALLLILIETLRLRWFVAAVGLDGRTMPLLRSEVGDLEKYRGLDFDEQVGFLRHRFCGVLQRGCDRIWARDARACHFVFVFDGLLSEPTGSLTQVFAEHLACWMVNPGVIVYRIDGRPCPGEILRLDRLAGQLDKPLEDLLLVHLAPLLAVRDDLGAWELAPKKGT
jgi:hypothetical protein